MRVITVLLYSIVLFTVVGSVGFVLGREVLLQLAISQIATSLGVMRQAAQKSGPYLLECRKKGAAPTEGETISSIQLRFTSDHEYVVEVLCTQFSLDPIIIHQRSLPPFVTKQ